MNFALTRKVRLGQFGFIRNIINNVYTIMYKHCFGEVGQGRPQYFGISVRFKGLYSSKYSRSRNWHQLSPENYINDFIVWQHFRFHRSRLDVNSCPQRYQDTQCGKQILYKVHLGLGSSMQLGVRTSMLYLILFYIGQFCSQCF